MANVSERRWGEISESDYEDAHDYCAASLIDANAPGEEKTKERCKLPVREPKRMGGKVNRNAVRAAAAVLAGARGGVDVGKEEQRKAARKLLALYRDLGEDAPEAITKLAKGR